MRLVPANGALLVCISLKVGTRCGVGQSRVVRAGGRLGTAVGSEVGVRSRCRLI